MMATADIKDIPSAHGKDSDPQQQTTKELKAERSQLRSNIMQIIKKVKSLMSDPENHPHFNRVHFYPCFNQ